MATKPTAPAPAPSGNIITEVETIIEDILGAVKAPLSPVAWLSVFMAIAGLAVSQAWISSSNGQLYGGIASIVIPAIIAIVDAVVQHGKAKVQAAAISAKAQLAVAKLQLPAASK